ncbi:regulation of nuclear pre-mRNA domain-containing protein 2 isoform X2 [Teleopsis dalmanni]|uniref:regulation of nuclear pre-mRNA domain-containing protein 2 isoform X2 n=1 Tax=Teleopsis dalmanni TaxID=139649 RepID=UPI0018CDD5BC|nr:regulation of nuclear pre-mRNA domain-containing protein 2 isoform X2 [Teleopsis dalmanni]
MTEFEEGLFEKRLEGLKDSQEGIQHLSTWCLTHRKFHKKIVASWLNVFKKVNIEHRLTLFYLANDVIQYSKRKKYEFVESWATALQKATTMVRDDKVKNKILRIFHIWEERDVYNEEYLSDLRGLLNIKPLKKTRNPIDISDFQHTNIVGNIRECMALSTCTDKSFKNIPKGPNYDSDDVKVKLRDKRDADDIIRNILQSIHCLEIYNSNLLIEINSRKALLSNLETAIKFYTHQRGEVKVVVNAYKNFGSRVKQVKKKLDDILPSLCSPIPSPDIDAPSPERDADLQLPDEQSSISINMIKSTFNGYTSYLDGNLPFDINDFKSDDIASKTPSQPIEVISSRSDDESFNSSGEYYKPEPLSTYHNPMPVPPVQSEYASLARTPQQYNNAQYSSGYSPHVPTYSTNNYNNNNSESGSYGTSNCSNLGKPLMPPPPPILSTSRTDVGNGSQTNTSNNFSSWNLSWTTSSTLETPVSPPHFEREAHSSNSSTIEYTENDSDLISVQDVDHRKVNLSATAKLALGKDPNRQLDIDHRNLISLTGSPISSDGDKNSWLSAEQTNKTGDIDYRTGPAKIQKMNEVNHISSPNTSPTKIPSIILNLNKSPPQRSNASSSSESQKEEISAPHDPIDMVIDMDMSDEDLDEIIREVAEQNKQQIPFPEPSSENEDLFQDVKETQSNATDNNRSVLLETPNEYVPQSIWNSTTGNQPNTSNYMVQNSNTEMPYQQDWNPMHLGWNGNGNNTGASTSVCVPPPPRPPLPFQLQYGNGNGGEYGNDYCTDYGSDEYMGNVNDYGSEYSNGVGNGINDGSTPRGRGRGWVNPSQYQYRGYSPRGNRGGQHNASPFAYRGMRMNNNTPRGGFRGKFRGNINPWS